MTCPPPVPPDRGGAGGASADEEAPPPGSPRTGECHRAVSCHLGGIAGCFTGIGHRGVPLWIGFLLLPALLVCHVVLGIVASAHASEGDRYRFPWTLRLRAP